MVTEETRKPRSSDLFDVSEHDLETALEGYLEEEEELPASKPGLINLVTVTGLVFLLVGFLAVIQYFLPIGIEMGSILNLLPLIGGVLVVLVGLGFFNKSRKKKKARKSDKNIESAWNGIRNDLNRSEATAPRTASKSTYSGQSATSGKQTSSDSDGIESFGLKKKKKLFRSRKEKRIFGVCGGLADYLDLDPTLVRIITVALFFFGYGTVLPIYIAMGLILPKEPKTL